jgi:hypothetical protein
MKKTPMTYKEISSRRYYSWKVNLYESKECIVKRKNIYILIQLKLVKLRISADLHKMHYPTVRQKGKTVNCTRIILRFILLPNDESSIDEP